MKVTPKLFLNNSPQTQEEGSLAFARNMKIDDDGNLVSDYGYEDIEAMANYNIVGHIVGLDNKIYFFTAVKNNNVWTNSEIIEYDEIEKTAISLPTAWTYSGGEIDGHVSTNVSGEKILTIAEYVNDINVEIPLKHINLKEVIVGDDQKTWPYANVADQSLYTQAPKCPTANLVLKDTYVKTIPNGVYVFFIRYKIRKDVYTNWFLCSRPIFGGTSEKITTLQGGLNYINLHKDSAKSFVFQLDFAVNTNKSSYTEFQLGFIITHYEATDARIWKSFNLDSFVDSPSDGQNLIYFDYEDVTETNIDDLLESTYELYNVRNVTAFKNKLYISNYKESNFNQTSINSLKDYIKLEIAHTKTQGSSDIDYKNMTYNNIRLNYDYLKGYYDKTIDNDAISDIISDSDFNFNVSKLVKSDVKEKNDVVTFDVYWTADVDPDIALVHNIYNNLHNKVIFGRDWHTPIPNTFTSSDDLNTVGLKIYDTGSNAFIYGPINKIVDVQNHPWYNLGFTFGFGSFASNEAGIVNYEKGCSIFNLYNYWFEYNYIAGRTPSRYVNTGWFTRDSGFGEYARSTIESTLNEEIKGRSIFAKCYVEIASGANVYLIGYDDAMDLDNYVGDNMSFDFMEDGPQPSPYQDHRTNPWKYYTDNHLEVLNPAWLSTSVLSDDLKDKIIDWIFDIIKNNIIGIDDAGTPVLNINNNVIKANSISIKFKKFDFTVDTEDIDTSSDRYSKKFKVSLKTTDYTSLCTFRIKDNCINIMDMGIGEKQISTLMPLSSYQPYIHFVDDHNIITNGCKLDIITTDSIHTNDDVIYLKYKVLNNFSTTNYKSFFISLVNVGDIVMEGFGYTKDPNNNAVNIIHCLEIDTLLYNINDNITIKCYNKSTGALERTISNGKYYSSGSVYPPLAFGNCGYVTWSSSDNFSEYNIYIVISRYKNTENINVLTKASAYIPLTLQSEFTEVPDGYYGSWRCLVKKPSFELSSSCYVSGRDVYAVDRTTALSLNDFKSFIQVQDSITYFIRSNFNLNYLSLTEDINDSIFAIGPASSGVKQVAKVINSATLSFVYELKSMYKDFANKTFGRIEEEYKIQFDNTIRVSNVLSDETFNNSIFKFTADNYYNVPTDRGIIVNLFSIGNNIFVHTKTSFYKFDGQQTISASDKDITLQESEPFDTGITQLFDAEYGYGGINNKEAGCITFDSYIFYDAMSNHIFAYGGNSQIQLIDATIYKLLCHYKPTNCRTLHDDANHRVLFEFVIGTNKSFTISYNYKSKSFVSIHNITLEKAFHSRYISYSYKDALCSLFNTDAGIDTNALFGDATLNSFLDFGAETQDVHTSPFNIAVVLFTQQNFREVVDSVNYIGNIIQDTYDEESSDSYDIIKIPQVTADNPVAKMYIITDVCVSTPVVSTIDDTVRPNPLTDYKGFKYDKGFWNVNYFRNNINKENIYNYPNQPRADQNPNSDNNSLVYGKYFIIVFDFINDTPIKFEQVNINNNNY